MKPNFWLTPCILVGAMVLLLACQSQREQEWIAYTGSQARIENGYGTSVIEIETDGAGVELKWSPDGTRMLLTIVKEEKASFWIANSDGSEPRQVSSEFDFIWGTWLNEDILITNVITKSEGLTTGTNNNYILDLQDGSMQLYSEGPESVIALPSGDQWLADNAFKTGLQLYNLEGETWALFPDFGPDYNSIALPSSGQEIVFYNDQLVNDKTSGLYNASLDRNKTVEPELIYPIEGGWTVRWSPNDQYIAVLDRLDTIHILNGKTFSLVKKIEIGPLQESSLIWSPDSKFIAVNKHFDDPEVSWQDWVKVNIETDEIIRLAKSRSLERIADWRILSLE